MGTQGLLLSNPAGALSLSHAHFPLSAASALRPRLLTSQPHRCHRLGETAAILKLSRKWHCWWEAVAQECSSRGIDAHGY